MAMKNRQLWVAIAILVVVMVGVATVVLRDNSTSFDPSTLPPWEYQRISLYCGVDVSSISFGRTVRDQVGNPVRLFITPVGEVIYFQDDRGICPDGTTFPR